MFLMWKYRNVLLLAVFHHAHSLQMYLESVQTKTFDDAILDCQTRGMELAIVNSQTAFDDAVAYIIAGDPTLSSIWIGYKTVDLQTEDFEWVNGDTSPWSKWLSGEPNLSSGPACAVLKQSESYQFADRSCTDVYGYLCTGPVASGNDDCLCSCNSVGISATNYQNYTYEELKDILTPVTKKLRQELLVDKKTLSTFKNKLISQKDDRPSAMSLGYLGMLFLILVSVLTILADLTSLFQTRKLKIGRLITKFRLR